MGRPAIWQSQSKDVPGMDYKFSVGPSTYQDEDDRDPDYYSIDVQSDNKNGSFSVLFQRDFRIDELPAGFLTKNIDEIATFDSSRSSVVFLIGDVEHVYRLPIKKAQQAATRNR